MHKDILKDIQLATQLHVDILNSKNNFSHIRNDVKCGLKSNIPVCCILFFCIIWKLIFCFMSFNLAKRFICWYPDKAKYDWEYVPCFMCFLLRRYRKVYVCSESDVNCCCFK